MTVGCEETNFFFRFPFAKMFCHFSKTITNNWQTGHIVHFLFVVFRLKNSSKYIFVYTLVRNFDQCIFLVNRLGTHFE